MATHPGVYCLRTNVADWATRRCATPNTTLDRPRGLFRSMKSKLGLRPIHHRKPVRAEGHLFITVVAYQAVQVIRRRPRDAGESCPASCPRASHKGRSKPHTMPRL